MPFASPRGATVAPDVAINSTGASALGALAITTIGLWLNTEFGNVMAIGGITSALLVGLHALTRDQAVAELPPEPTTEELAAAFRRAPGDCFFQYDGEHYGWPKEITPRTLLQDIYVRTLGQDVGYVQDICFISPTCVRIGHFATKAAGQRKGTGTVLARYLANQLSTRYGVTQILFAQRHPRPHDTPFFASLGAVPVEAPRSIVPDWLWTLPPHSE